MPYCAVIALAKMKANIIINFKRSIAIIMYIV